MLYFGNVNVSVSCFRHSYLGNYKKKIRSNFCRAKKKPPYTTKLDAYNMWKKEVDLGDTFIEKYGERVREIGGK